MLSPVAVVGAMSTFIAIDAGRQHAGVARRGRSDRGIRFSPVGVRGHGEGWQQLAVEGLRCASGCLCSRTSRPTCVAAAGMITSALGLKEIIHCDAPAGVTELASRRQVLCSPKSANLPIWLFTGVRCGDWTNPDAAETCDMMRGEETLCWGWPPAGRVRL